MIKKLTIVVCLLATCAQAQFRRSSDSNAYPYTATLQSDYVFIIGDPGNTNFNFASSNLLSIITNVASAEVDDNLTIVTNIAAFQAYLATNGWTAVASNIAAYQAQIATNGIVSGTTYTNNTGLAGRIIGNGIGSNTTTFALISTLGTAAYSNSASFQNASATLSNVVSGASNAYVGKFTGLITTGDATNAAGSRVAYLSDTNGLSGGGSGTTNEIFSYNLSAASLAAATSIVLDRAAAFPQTIAGHICIGFGTTNAEVRPCSSVSSATVSFTRPLTFAHASGERVIYFGGDRADIAWWGVVPNSGIDAAFPLLQAIYETANEGLWLWGPGTYYTTMPIVSPPSGRIRNVSMTALAGYTGVGHTNAFMLWSSQGERLPFTATAVDDTISFSSSWNPPAGDATNSRVVFYGLGGTALPAPLSNGIPYYVHVYTSTNMKVGLSTNVSEIVDITANGTGYAYTEVGSLERLYLHDVVLNAGAQVNLNGLYAQMQQPSYWGGVVRLQNFGGKAAWINGQQLLIDQLQIGVCGIGLFLGKDYGQQTGMQFMRIGFLNVEEYTNAVVLGGGNNIIGSVHLETPLTDTSADFDGSIEAGSIVIHNFFATHGNRTNTVFKMGSAGSFPSTLDIQPGYVSCTVDADTLLLDDRFRSHRIFAYKTTTGASRSFGHLQSFNPPDSAGYSDLGGGYTVPGMAGRLFNLGMTYGPWLLLRAGTNDTEPLLLPLRSDSTTNSYINAAGDFISRSNTILNQLSFYTNSNPVVPDFKLSYQLFQTNAAFAFLPPIGVDTSQLLVQTCVVMVTNSTAAPVIVTVPATVNKVGTFYVTNLTTFTFFCYGQKFTNCVALPIF